MAIDKPKKPTDLIPRSFGGEKADFSDSLKANGYEAGIPAIYGGKQLNYQIDTTGKELEYCETVVDYMNNISVGKTPIVDSDNKLTETQVGVKVYNVNETFNLNDKVVYTDSDNKTKFYNSKVQKNKGNALTDTNSWEEISLGMGYEYIQDTTIDIDSKPEITEGKEVIFQDPVTGDYLVPYSNASGGTSLPLFSTILMDKVLTYEETKGYALQGTYVYKEAVAGSRYGYPDFVAKCIEEMNAGVATETTLGDNTVTMYVNSNGHQFYNISDKDAIDTWFNTYGIADFYGVDTENQRVFLPRNKYFIQLTVDTSDVNKMNEAGLPNITGTTDYIWATREGTSTGALTKKAVSGEKAGGGTSNTYTVSFDASNSNSIYGNSDTVQPPSSNKLLYYVVGNTTNYEGITDVVNQGMTILEQVNQGLENKVDLDAQNLSNAGTSYIAGLGMPSDKYIDLTLGSSGTSYTAPANGWYSFRGGMTQGYFAFSNVTSGFISPFEINTVSASKACGTTICCVKGDKIQPEYNATLTVSHFRFYYAQGEV